MSKKKAEPQYLSPLMRELTDEQRARVEAISLERSRCNTLLSQLAQEEAEIYCPFIAGETLLDKTGKEWLVEKVEADAWTNGAPYRMIARHSDAVVRCFYPNAAAEYGLKRKNDFQLGL